jgi:hypothetical protein
MGLVLLAAGLTLGGCGGSDKYTDEAQGYTIVFPDGWKVKPDAMGRVTAFAPTQGPDEFQSFISVQKVGAGKDARSEQFMQQEMLEESTVVINEQGQRAARPGFNKVLENDKTTISGYDAAWVSYSYNMGKDLEVNAISYFVTDGTGRGYRITGATAASQFSKLKPTFEKAALSLKFLPSPTQP